MTEETNQQAVPSVPEMLRTTGRNTADFMGQIASHIEQLEYEVVRLQNRIIELESKQNGTN